MILHEYEFKDTTVNPRGLMFETKQALRDYDYDFLFDPRAYFRKLFNSLSNHPKGLAGTGAHIQPLAILNSSHNEYSTTEAVVWQNSWASPLSPKWNTDFEGQYTEFVENGGKRPRGLDTSRISNLISADFTREVLKQSGVTDEKGKYLPVLAFSSPSLDWHPKIDRQTKVVDLLGQSIAYTVRAIGYKSLHLAGVGLGASVVGDLAGNKADYFGKTITEPPKIESMLLSEYPSYTKRTMSEVLRAYVCDGKDLKINNTWSDQGPLPRIKLADDDKEKYSPKNIFHRNLVNNSRVLSEMAENKLRSALEVAVDEEIPVTIEFGEASKVGGGVKKAIADLKLGILDMQILKSTGCTPHAHTENSVFIADAVARSIRFAKDGPDYQKNI